MPERLRRGDNITVFLHLAHGYAIATDNIVGIFDLDNTTGSQITLEFLRRAEEAGDLINIAEGVPRAFIVTGKKGGEKVYLSNFVPATLYDRIEAWI
jgi:hypothetical protein